MSFLPYSDYSTDQYLKVLVDLNILPADYELKKGIPCPVSSCPGTKDSFAFTNYHGNGTWSCRKHPNSQGGSIDTLVSEYLGVSKPKARMMILEKLGSTGVSDVIAQKIANSYKSFTKAKPITAPTDIQYLVDHGIEAHRARLGTGYFKGDGFEAGYYDALLIEQETIYQQFVSLQYIALDPSKGKRFAANVPNDKMVLMHIFKSKDKDNKRVLIAEGFATSAALFEATGYSVVCAFTAGRLRAVSRTIRQRYGDKVTIVLCGDHDKTKTQIEGTIDVTEKKSGQYKAAVAAQDIKALYCLPPTPGHDFCDIRDKDAIKQIVDSAEDPPEIEKPEEDLTDEELSEIGQISLAEGDLLAAVETCQLSFTSCVDDRSDWQLFQRGSILVHIIESKEPPKPSDKIQLPVSTLRVTEVKGPWLECFLESHNTFRNGGRRVNASPRLAGRLIGLGNWPAYPLRGPISTPIIRPDSSLYLTPGYDKETGLYLTRDLSGLELPTLSRDEAIKAKGRILNIVRSFPFVSDIDRSVYLSAVLTLACRSALPNVLFHAFDAPTAGTGKGLLVNTICTMILGRTPVIITQGFSKEELDKRIETVLTQGHEVVCIDNITEVVESVPLMSALTEGKVSIRKFHSNNETSDIDISTTFLGTGNGLAVTGDMLRRTLICSLDAKTETPELRHFENDPLMDARRDPIQLLTDCLTIYLSYRASGSPQIDDAAPLGSFEAWSRSIRDAIKWLDMPDPVDKMEEIKTINPARVMEKQLLELLHNSFGSNQFTAKQIIVRFNDRYNTGYGSEPGDQDLENMITELAGGRTNRSIVNYLQQKNNLRRDEYRLEVSSNTKGISFTVRKVGDNVTELKL